MARRLVGALALLAALAPPAIAGQATTPHVRLVVGVDAGGPARLAADPGPATGLAGAAAATARIAVAAGTTVRALDARGRVLASATVGSAPAQTLVLVARPGGDVLLPFVDQRLAPADATRIRVAHAAGAVGPLDVRIRRGAPLARGLRLGRTSATADLPGAQTGACGGVALLDVRAAGSTLPGASPKIPAPVGAATTVYIVGYRPGDLYPLDYVTVVDAIAGVPVAPSVPRPDAAAPTRRAAPAVPRGIRLFNAISTSGAVTLRIDGRDVGRRVPYGGTTRHVAAGAGSHLVEVVHDGVVIASARVRVTAARPRRTVALHGLSVRRASLLALADAPPRDPATARLRLVHVDAGAPALDVAPTGGGAALADGLRYATATSYVGVPVAAFGQCFGLLRLDLARSRDGAVLKHSRLAVEEGRAFTAFAIRPPGAPRGKVKLVILDDRV